MDSLAIFLERSGSFRVLRRLDVQTTPMPERLPPGHRLALFLDTETTGLEPNTDEIIEFAAVPFSYDRDGTILAVHEPFDQPRDPGRLIPAEVTRLTGIDDAMVQGKTIDMKAIERLLSVTHLVIAHNAQFDRAFAERLCPLFASLPWACSMTDVPWREEDVTTLKLEFLAMRANLFFDAHRAQIDCLAAVEILRRPLPLTGRIAMTELLRNARRTGVRIAAVKAPFDRKELLKSRGYRWRSTPDAGVMAWTVEVGADRRDDEIKFLREEVYGACVELPITRVDAYCRYSARI